jgi:hypothetical protein
MLNDLLNAYNVGKEPHLRVQQMQICNKYAIKDGESQVPRFNLDIVYTNDMKAKLRQPDEEQIEINKKKMEMIQKLNYIEQQKYKKSKRGRRKLGEEGEDYKKESDEDDFDEADDDDSDSPGGIMKKTSLTKSGSKLNQMPTNLFNININSSANDQKNAEYSRFNTFKSLNDVGTTSKFDTISKLMKKSSIEKIKVN